MAVLGLDYSAGRPRAAEVAKAGYRFVARYLSYQGNPKDLTATEAADMQAYGVAIVLVYETTADRAVGGYAAGVSDAHAAQVEANALGLGCLPIYMAVDFDVPDYAPNTFDATSKLGPVANYLMGAVSVLGLHRTGVYGGYWVVKRALDAGLATYAWQAAAWSGGQIDPRAHLYQHIGTVVVDGVECDLNEARAVDFGQSGALTAGDTMTTFLYNAATGESATQDGPLVSGINTDTAKASLAAWPGSCQIGVSQAEWDDRVTKSSLITSIPGKLDALLTAVQALMAALPVAGGAGVSSQQLVDAITAGVQAALSGVTETTTTAKRSS